MGGVRLNAPAVEIRQPRDAREMEAAWRLRWEVLRKPWGRPPGSERDELDATARLYFAIDDQGRVLATGRVHNLDETTAQIRYFAVHPAHTRQGLGTRLLVALETDAAAHGAKRIMLQAREIAVDFYRHCGYRVMEKTYLLFDSIQHYRMEKVLPETPSGNTP